MRENEQGVPCWATYRCDELTVVRRGWPADVTTDDEEVVTQQGICESYTEGD